MRNRLDMQLDRLNRELIQMGALCEEAIALTANALMHGDQKNVAQVATIERDIDQMERDIESLCLKLILQQQPVAHDLRQISAALKMITDMERIGDQAVDIAEIISSLEGTRIKQYEDISHMAQAAIKMVTESIDAYVKQDLTIADAAITHDDIVDNYFIQIKRSLIEMIAHHHIDGEFALDLLMIAKYFERIADHAVNIAEWVIFSVTGEHKKEV